MKNKKRYIFITGIIAITSFLIMLILQFRLYIFAYEFVLEFVESKEHLANMKQFGINISSGIFTGAILTFLLSIIDYYTERKNALEEMYFATLELFRLFEDISFFLPEEPRELVKNYLSEMDNNSMIEKHNNAICLALENSCEKEKIEKTYEQFHQKKTNESEKKIKEYIWKNLSEEERKKNKKEEYLNAECERKRKQYVIQLEEVIKSYLQFKDISINGLTRAYGKIDFIFSNKYKQNIHEELYCKLYKKIKEIKYAIFNFEEYYNNSPNNKAAICEIVWKLQDGLLSEDKEQYYYQFRYEISLQLTKLLARINGKTYKKDNEDIKQYTVGLKPGVLEKRIKAYKKMENQHEKNYLRNKKKKRKRR